MKMNTEIKKCTMCGELKNRSEYIKKCGRCRPCRSVHRKKYRQDNLSNFKEKDKTHYDKYREQKRQQQAEYYKKNAKKIQAQRKVYREKYSEKHKEMAKKRYYGNLDLRLGIVYRTRVRREIKSGKGYLKYLGCSIDHLKQWFQFNFGLDEYLGFTWDNHGKVWEIDHVTPCCKHNLQNENEI